MRNNRLTFIVIAALVPYGSGNIRAQSPATSGAADSLFAARDYSRAVREYEAIVGRGNPTPRDLMRLGSSAYNLGDYRRAAAAFVQAAEAGAGGAALYNAGAMHARLGDPDAAFVWLTKADSSGFVIRSLLSSDEDLAGIRNDARFAELVGKAERTAFPCMNDPAAQRLNFWVGDWQVFNALQQNVGSSSVQPVSGGCAVYENWTDSQGGQGKSLSTWNSARGQWQQFWVSQRGVVTEYRSGEWKDNSMVMVGDGLTRNGVKSLIRMTLTPVDPTTVRQMFEMSLDAGATWNVTSDLQYRRRE